MTTSGTPGRGRLACTAPAVLSSTTRSPPSAAQKSRRAAGVRSGCSSIGHVGAVDGPPQQLQRRVVELVVLDQHLERAEAVAVGVGRARRVVAVAALAFGGGEYLVCRHVDELGLRVDE